MNSDRYTNLYVRLQCSKNLSERYFDDFNRELELKISTKYKNIKFSDAQSNFVFPIEEFWEAINDFFFVQDLSSAIMSRSVLESAIQRAIILFYQNKLLEKAKGKKFNDLELLIADMDYFYDNMSSFDKSCKIMEDKLKILSREQIEGIKRLRELGNFSAHFVERIFNGPSRMNEYNKDMKGISQKLADLKQKTLEGNVPSIDEYKNIAQTKIDISSEEAKEILDGTKQYLIEIISNSIYEF